MSHNMLFSQVKEIRSLWPWPVNTGRAKTSLFGRSTRVCTWAFFRAGPDMPALANYGPGRPQKGLVLSRFRLHR